MAEKPGLLGKLLAFVQGEVSADTLESYRRAGSTVHPMLHKAEAQRLHLKIEGLNPYRAPLATQAHLLCVWNAFTLQTLGDQFLDADYRSNPATVGYVPPKTADQIFAFYDQVEGWVSRASQAQSNPAYRLDVEVPAELPPWSEVEPCPQSHLDGMMAAARSLRTHAEIAMGAFEAEGLPASQQNILYQLRQLAAAATSKIEYAEQLWGDRVSAELHEKIEDHAKTAIECYYQLGQFLAMPQLLEQRASSQPARQPASQQLAAAAEMACVLALPGRSGFDPWCITDPFTRAEWQRDPEAQESIEEMWKHDPAPDRTLAIQTQINQAMLRGDIAYATDNQGDRIGHFYCCPWSPIYVVKRGLIIGLQRLRTLQKFTYEVDADEVLEGGKFKRHLLVGNFKPTTKTGYCNPHEGGHHDD
jgi:hypothetical protein